MYKVRMPDWSIEIIDALAVAWFVALTSQAKTDNEDYKMLENKVDLISSNLAKLANAFDKIANSVEKLTVEKKWKK